MVSFKVYRERFGSRVTLRPAARRIDVEYLEGPFRYLQNHWQFVPRGDERCEVDFFVDFEFRSAILQKLIGLVFHEAMQRIVRAFEKRAAALYGSRGQRLKRQLERRLHAPRPHRARGRARRSRGARARVSSARGGGEPDQPLGLCLRRARPGDAGDGDRERRRPRRRARPRPWRAPPARRPRRARPAAPAAPRASPPWPGRNRLTKPRSKTSDEPAMSVIAALTSPPVQLSAVAIRSAAGAGRLDQRPGVRLGDHRSHPCATPASERRRRRPPAAPAMTSSSITPVGPLRRSAQPTGPGFQMSKRRKRTKAATQPGQGKTLRRRAGEPEAGRERHQRDPLARPPRR